LAGLLISLALTALPTKAQEPFSLEMPLRCSLGIDCWIVNYVDMEPTGGVKDYMCSDASYDTHKGTDFAVKDVSVMRNGVEVYASAAGIVREFRNNMRDIDFSQGDATTPVEGKECGNGILLDHGNGWTTQYCHLLRGSVIVAKNDKVESGQPIGLVGLSGLTEFPHVHIQVKYNEQIVDPFAGLGRTKKCGIGKAPLWKTSALLSMLYEPTALYNAGFSSTTPNARIAREGLYGGEVLFKKSPVIALWTDIFWVNQGDKLQFTITGPDGETIMAHTTTLKKKQARRFAYAGINRNEEPWPKGSYTGEIRLIRPGSDEKYKVLKVINVN
jgi:murein DD-endopeptidase MepM/ murein hydrolase activator NlpD